MGSAPGHCGPLTQVTEGLSRTLMDNPSRRSGHMEVWIAQISKLTVQLLGWPGVLRHGHGRRTAELFRLGVQRVRSAEE